MMIINIYIFASSKGTKIFSNTEIIFFLLQKIEKKIQ